MTAGSDGVVADAERLERFAANAFRAAGLDDAAAAVGANVLVRTTLRGVDSHGIRALPHYVRQLQDGGANLRPQVRNVADHGAVLVVDGDAGLGLALAERCTRDAIDRAGRFGLALVSVRNGNHFGAAGHYALLCAEAGRIGLIMSNTAPIMTVTGARGRVMGNSPLAFGAPRTSAPPVVLDVAMSRVAGGKVRMALARGAQVPHGWITDAEGRPTTAPEDFLLRGGALLPMEDHKGYGLALMVETLTGALSGAAMAGQVGNWLRTPDTPTDTGFFLMAIDVGAGGPFDGVSDRVRQLCDEITGAPRAPSVERIYVPGEMEHEREVTARADGVRLPAEVWSGLGEVAVELRLDDEFHAVVR